MRRREFVRTSAAVVGGAALAGTAAGDTTTTDVRVESFDGIEIAATVYEPAGAGPHPAVLITHGYGGFKGDPTVTREAERYASAGYVVCAYDSRGFGASEGVSGFNGPKEVGDALTLVDSLPDLAPVVTDERGVPRVGMDGLSYGGAIQQNTAAARPSLADQLGLDLSFPLAESPLDAIVPRMTWNDLAYAAAPNGVIKQGWDAAIVGAGAPSGYGLATGNPTVQGPDPRIYGFVAEGVATNELPPEAEAYFDRRSPLETRPADLDVPTLLLQGWPDNLLTPNEAVRSFHALREDGTPARLLLYPGGHDDTELGRGLPAAVRAKLDRASLAWLDHHVHPDPPRSPSLPEPVTMHTDRPARNGGSAWRTADAFPPRDATERTLPLSAAARTETTPLANSAAPTSFRGPTGTLVASPSGDAPATSAAFDFRVVEACEVVGTPRLDLAVEPLGGEPHLFAKLKRVTDGVATTIDEQVMAFQASGEGVQSVSVDLVALQQYLDAGERLRLVLSTTDNGYASARESAGARLHHAAEESALTVPVVGPESALSGTTDPI